MYLAATTDGIRQEKHFLRDLRMSERHRAWGIDCPAVDIDLLLVEFNFGEPAALVEYKHHNAAIPDLNHPTYRALRSLADSAQLPFMVVFYWPDTWAFRVHPANTIAKQHYDAAQEMTEREFVASLYRLRQRIVTKHLKNTLNNERPE